MAEVRASSGIPGRPLLRRPVPIDPAGRVGPTPGQVRGPHWRRTSRGLFVRAGTVDSTEQRVLEAATVAPAHGAVTGWAAVHWMGHERWFEGLAANGVDRLPVRLAIGGEEVREQRGIAVCAERLDPRDVVSVDDVRVTTAVRSVCFEMRYARGVRDAARVLSMAAYHDAVSVEEMAEYASRHSGWTGIPRCREALLLAEENCWSPPELEMVLVWRLDAELPRPWCNRPVFDRRGNHIGTPDLLDEEAGVVGEYDGSLHLQGAQRTRDVDREEAFRRVGLEYFSVLSSHRADRRRLARRMHAVRSRARFAAAGQRPWTVEPPAGWIPTHTVDLRRNLTPYQRGLLLRYRAA